MLACSFQFEKCRSGPTWLPDWLCTAGSSLDIMRTISPRGLDETVIASILRETLKALAYFHHNGQIHRCGASRRLQAVRGKMDLLGQRFRGGVSACVGMCVR